MSQGVRAVCAEVSRRVECEASKESRKIRVAIEMLSSSPPHSNRTNKKRIVTQIFPEIKEKESRLTLQEKREIPDSSEIPDFPLKRNREPSFQDREERAAEKSAGSKRYRSDIGEGRRDLREEHGRGAPPEFKKRRRASGSSSARGIDFSDRRYERESYDSFGGAGPSRASGSQWFAKAPPYQYDSGYETRANDQYRRSYSLTHQSDRRSRNMGPKVHSLPMKGEIFLRAIKAGTKKFEGRVHATQCQKMQVGDQLRLFDNRARWGILCEIVSKDIFPDFEPMLKAKGILTLLPQLEEDSKKVSSDELMRRAVAIYRGFPGSQRVHKLGAAAIGVKWIKDV